MIIKVAGATVAVDASTYAAGDLVGAKLTLSNAYTANGLSVVFGFVA